MSDTSDTPPATYPPPALRGYSNLALTLTAAFCFLLGAIVGAIAYPRLLAFAETGVLSGCSVPAWWEQAAPVVTRFIDETETASQTARLSLSPIVLDLRETQREFEAIETPECATVIRSQVAEGMGFVVSGFNDFLGRATPGSDFTTAYNAFREAYYGLASFGIECDARLENIWASAS
jgi:hypothetical protein